MGEAIGRPLVRACHRGIREFCLSRGARVFMRQARRRSCSPCCRLALSSLSDDRRPSMTREFDERMWNLAYRLARSAEHQNYQAIEWELQAFGYPQARQLLYHERVRERLDGIC